MSFGASEAGRRSLWNRVRGQLAVRRSDLEPAIRRAKGLPPDGYAADSLDLLQALLETSGRARRLIRDAGGRVDALHSDIRAYERDRVAGPGLSEDARDVISDAMEISIQRATLMQRKTLPSSSDLLMALARHEGIAGEFLVRHGIRRDHW